VKKKFEIKIKKIGNILERTIFIDGELLDWSVDVNKLAEAMARGPNFFDEAKENIETELCEIVSEELGREVNPQEIREAVLSGWI